MQQGQPDDPEERLGASGKEKTSVGVRHPSGRRVVKDWVRGLLRTAEDEGAGLGQSEGGGQLGGLGGWVPGGEREGGRGSGSQQEGAGAGNSRAGRKGCSRGGLGGTVTCKGGRRDLLGGAGTKGGVAAGDP